MPHLPHAMKTILLALLTSVIITTATKAEPPATATATEAKIVYSAPIKLKGNWAATVGYPELPEEKNFLQKVNEPAVSLWAEIPLPPKPEEKEKEKAKAKANANAKAKGESKTPEAEPKEIPSKDYKLSLCDGKYAGWFGILREVKTTANGTTWLLEHKYFDGCCDVGIQLVSIYGAGDFSAKVPADGAQVPLLSLVRIYGKVSQSAEGKMAISPEFVRVWKQPLFSFMDYGDDHSNPKWIALRKVTGTDVYDPFPKAEFYNLRLGPAPETAGK